MARNTSENGKGGCLLTIVYLCLAAAAFSVLSYLWQKFTSLPPVVIALVVAAIIAVCAFLIVWRVRKKKAAQQTKQVELEPMAIEPVTQPEIPVPQRPAMPKATVRVVSSGSNDDSMYDYEYNDVGVYRPDTADLPLPPIGAALEFENDPTNPYDDKAIKAVWEGRTVGWLYRKGKREMIRDWIDRGDYYVAEVTENDPELRFWIGMDRS